MPSILPCKHYIVQYRYFKDKLYNNLSFESCPRLVWGRPQLRKSEYLLRLAL